MTRRRATGQVIEHDGADGTVYRAVRFRAYGERRYLSLGPVSRDEAERALRGILADVERGTWQPAPDPAPAPSQVPTLHELAEEWWVEHEREWRPKTRADYRWRLEHHVLPALAERAVSAIAVADVDRLKASLLEHGLAPSSVNKCLKTLAQILDVAVERDHAPRNVALGRRRRVREPAPRRTYLDSAHHVRALLDAARRLDSTARSDRRHVHRHALLAVLTLAGLRLGEARMLRWRDVDLASGWLHVGDAKTDAGRRRVRVRPALRDALVTIKPAAGDPDAIVFATRTGRPIGHTNVIRRVLRPAIAMADEQLAERQLAPLPEGLTPHSLRRTFASLLYALGEPPPVVMAELGHAHPALALAIYAHVMRRDERETRALRALVEGADWADTGRREGTGTAVTAGEPSGEEPRTAP